MTKSRKKRGGDKLVSSCSMPGASCPKVTSAAGSLIQMTKAGIKLTNQKRLKKLISYHFLLDSNEQKG